MADLSRRAGDALRALVAAGRIKSAWLPGMRWTSQEGAVRGVQIRDRWIRYFREGDVFALEVVPRDLLDPDTDDPLTVFGLLLLAREALREPMLSVYAHGLGSWSVACPKCGRSWGHTEAEAIVAALEDAASRPA